MSGDVRYVWGSVPISAQLWEILDAERRLLFPGLDDGPHGAAERDREAGDDE